MNREFPNLNHSIVHPLIGWEEQNKTEVNYIKTIEKFERDCEKSLIETLSRVGTDATVKTDPYSLPYNEELVITLNGESYLNGPYEFYRIARKIVREVLEKNLYKLRFYMFIEVITPQNAGLLGALGQVKYSFRYHIPKKTE
jgi:hypothetical protein